MILESLAGIADHYGKDFWDVVDDNVDMLEIPGLYEDLCGYFAEDMPYGVSKVQTGDPIQWMTNKLQRIYG